jgi:tetratricopeptide (TPR) repeat protein
LREEEEVLARDKAQGNEDNQVVANSLTMREALVRFRFLAGTLGREERLAQQQNILAERKALHRRQPSVGRYAREVGTSAEVLAGVLLELGRAAEALAVVDEVLPSLEKLVSDDEPDHSMPPELDSRNYMIRRAWANLLARKGEAQAQTGKATDAGTVLRQAIEISEDLANHEPCYLYDLAQHLTLASTQSGKECGPGLADRAIKALRDFKASGFDNPYKLRHDPRFEPLRSREDFQKLVKDLEGATRDSSANDRSHGAEKAPDNGPIESKPPTARKSRTPPGPVGPRGPPIKC